MKQILLSVVLALSLTVLTACGSVQEPEETVLPAENTETTASEANILADAQAEEDDTETSVETTAETTAETETLPTEATTEAASTEETVAPGHSAYSILGAWQFASRPEDGLMLFGPDGKMEMLMSLETDEMNEYWTFENGEIGFTTDFDEVEAMLKDVTREEDIANFRIYELELFGEDMVWMYYILDKESTLFIMSSGDYFTYEITEEVLTLQENTWKEDTHVLMMEFVDADTIRLTEEEDGEKKSEEMTRVAHLDALTNYLN